MYNPEQDGENTNEICTKFVRDTDTTVGHAIFALYPVIEKAQEITITFKAYIDKPTSELESLAPNATNLRVYFENKEISNAFYEQQKFEVGQSWQTYTFVFNVDKFEAETLDGGGYDEFYIGFANGFTSDQEITYYIDEVVSSINSEKELFHWHEDDSDINNIVYDRDLSGNFTNYVTNPDNEGINNNGLCSQFVRDPSKSSGFTIFDLNPNIEESTIEAISDIEIRLSSYIDIPDSFLDSAPARLRVYLLNTTNGVRVYKQINILEGQTWERNSFIFNHDDFTAEGLSDGGYDKIYIGYGNGIFYDSEVTYYIDQIDGSINQERESKLNNVEWLQGSWGARLYVRGGESLDTYVRNGYNYVGAADAMVTSYTTMGHVITNATNNAASQLWTLRTNENVNEVMGAEGSVVNEEMVPTIENEQIIIDVIRKFKENDKKVILYLNTMNPSNRGSDEIIASWEAYVDEYFEGNVHKAWMNYCEGYIKRFADLDPDSDEKLKVDGYWLDAFSLYPGDDDDREEFINMIRGVDSNLALTVNLSLEFILDGNGARQKVINEGIEDITDKKNNVLKLIAADDESYSDYTDGHISKVDIGSFAYDEFTILGVEESSTSVSELAPTKKVLKHLFTPIRDSWSVPRFPLMFDEEKAYRFVKRITDAGGAITFSTTPAENESDARENTDPDISTLGFPMEDEQNVLEHVNEQLALNAEYVPYTRPLGAFILGEDEIYPWYEYETLTDVDYLLSDSTVGFAGINRDAVNEWKVGINGSDTVVIVERDPSVALSSVEYPLPNPITDLSSLKIYLDVYADITDEELESHSRIRIYLKKENQSEEIYREVSLSAGGTWESLVFDFSDEDAEDGDVYESVSIGFSHDSGDGYDTKYAYDNFAGSKNQYSEEASSSE